MAHESGDEPLELVMATAGVTQLQLHRWQRQGLLPSPRQRGLGRGRGSAALYRVGSALQALAIRRLLACQRSIAYVQWRLWMEGFAIAESQIRKQLEEELEDLEHYSTGVRALLDLEDAPRPLSEGELDNRYRQLERLCGQRFGTKVLRRMRRHARPEQFPRLILLFSEIAAGCLGPGGGVGDVELVGRALNVPLEIPRDYSPVLWLADLNDPAKLRAALLGTSDVELQAARDELRPLVGSLSLLIDAAAAIAGPSMVEIARLARTPVVPLPAQLRGMLIWLRLRRSARALRVYAALLRVAESMSPVTPADGVWASVVGAIRAAWEPTSADRTPPLVREGQTSPRTGYRD